jgi:REP element-mobilizing transposase RayT
MPRKPRLDIPGVLYHIIARGIDRCEIYRDDIDGNFFLNRLGILIKETKTPIYAFSLVPNHFHLLLRRGKTPISSVMQRLLTSYAIYFNKRHSRVGHLFQNRYKSILCEDDPYFLELVRYIHLNPIKAHLIKGLTDLEKYRFSGHSYILGKFKSDWFSADLVLAHFASSKRKAIKSYIKFVNDGLGAKSDFDGGGLRRSLGNSKLYSKERQLSDDRILGDGSFVGQLLNRNQENKVAPEEKPTLHSLISSVCKNYKVTETELQSKIKRRRVTAARANLAYRMSKEMGLTGNEIARQLSLSKSAVSKMIRHEGG